VDGSDDGGELVRVRRRAWRDVRREVKEVVVSPSRFAGIHSGKEVLKEI
jgi:hypothetical protein